MKTFDDCLESTGFTEEEISVLDDAALVYQEAGYSPGEALRLATQDAINRYDEQLASIEAQRPVPESEPELFYQPDTLAMDTSQRFRRAGDFLIGEDSVMPFTLWEKAEDIAKAYVESVGLEYTRPSEHFKVDVERGREIAHEFALMEHNPEDPLVKKAFAAMIKETSAQYELIIASGLKVEFIKGDDPYNGVPKRAIDDIINNNHMWVYSTKDGFGVDDTISESPLLAETEFMANGEVMLANDVFRVVHDYFGHARTGATFRATGEENAWQSHASMYSPLARRAMTTETRGQNSVVNFGPHGQTNQTASGEETIYADQKVGLLPIWVSEENRVSADVRRKRFEEARRTNTTGFEGAIDGQGRVELVHWSHGAIDRTEPKRWTDRIASRAEQKSERILPRQNLLWYLIGSFRRVSEGDGARQ